MKHSNFRNRSRLGFTMLELLVIVGIITILAGISISGAAQMMKSVSQTQLDAKAETVYMAVQNQLSRMRTSGRAALYQPDDSILFDSRVDCYLAPNSNGGNVGRPVYDAVFTQYVLPSGFMTDTGTNSWVVEYDPTTGRVNAVFYTETAGALDDYETNSAFNSDMRDLDYRRAHGGQIGYYGTDEARIQYTDKDGYTLVPTLTVLDGSELIVRVSCPQPTRSVEKDIKLDILVADTDNPRGHYKPLTATASLARNNDGDLFIPDGEDGLGIYYYDIVIDSLRSEVGEEASLTASDHVRFCKKFGGLCAGQDITVTVTASCEDRMVADSKPVTVTCNSLFHYDPDLNEANREDNGCNTVAYIANGRHLQNLDEASGVNARAVRDAYGNDRYITEAHQVADVFFEDIGEKGDYLSDWMSVYGVYSVENRQVQIFGITIYTEKIPQYGYFNGNDTSNRNTPFFKPITNDKLRLYDGLRKAVEQFDGTRKDEQYEIYGLYERDEAKFASYNAGLFSKFEKQTIIIQNIRLSGTDIEGTNAGALVGYIGREGRTYVTLNNCQVYLTPDDYRGKYSTSYSKNRLDRLDRTKNSYPWIEGSQNAGGLIGKVEADSGATVRLIVNSCSASTVVHGGPNAGGLIGASAHNDLSTRELSVRIQKSYADCYLRASLIAGGLIGYNDAKTGTGRCQINLSQCYAAGFGSGGADFFGLSGNTAKGGAVGATGYLNYVTNCYTVFDVLDNYIKEEEYELQGMRWKEYSFHDKLDYSTATNIKHPTNVYYLMPGKSTRWDSRDVSGTKCIESQAALEDMEKTLFGDKENGFYNDSSRVNVYNLQEYNSNKVKKLDAFYPYPQLRYTDSIYTYHYGDWTSMRCIDVDKVIHNRYVVVYLQNPSFTEFELPVVLSDSEKSVAEQENFQLARYSDDSVATGGWYLEKEDGSRVLVIHEDGTIVDNVVQLLSDTDSRLLSPDDWVEG